MVETIHQIISITEEPVLLQEFYEFEESLTGRLTPLREKLAQQILSSDAAKLENNMTFVESWRDRVSMYLRLAEAFVEHAKSSHFMLVKQKGTTLDDRTAYQKKLTAGMLATAHDLLRLIDSIDSRVNLAKKLYGVDDNALKYSIGKRTA
jgi:hypothetical protein